jgi:hypothetical protein
VAVPGARRTERFWRLPARPCRARRLHAPPQRRQLVRPWVGPTEHQRLPSRPCRARRCASAGNRKWTRAGADGAPNAYQTGCGGDGAGATERANAYQRGRAAWRAGVRACVRGTRLACGHLFLTPKWSYISRYPRRYRDITGYFVLKTVDTTHSPTTHQQSPTHTAIRIRPPTGPSTFPAPTGPAASGLPRDQPHPTPPRDHPHFWPSSGPATSAPHRTIHISWPRRPPSIQTCSARLAPSPRRVCP